MSALLLTAIEGANPLGYLAALGALRLSSLRWPAEKIRLRWVQTGGWQPELFGIPVRGEDEFCRILQEEGQWVPLADFAVLGKNLTVSPEAFGAAVRRVVKQETNQDRRAADFAAAFGCDVLADKEKGRIRYTDLCFITGSGHQDFLGTANSLARSTKAEHLREALFGPWRYADRSLSLRWDPDDAKEYALQWTNPSSEGVTSIWGANRLAFEALPVFPVVAAGNGPRTIGFQRRGRSDEFTWPIWTPWAGLDVVRSLVCQRELQADKPDRASLSAIGVAEIFRAQRVRIGQGANFKVNFRPARAV
jgi:hypothetical protein